MPLLKGLFQRINALFRRSAIDDELYEELEELLVAGDVSVRTATEITGLLRARVREQRVTDPAVARRLLREILVGMLAEHCQPLVTDPPPGGGPRAYLVVGVNGTGKTTTIAKLAYRLRAQGRRVILAAADTFRVAAIEQLQVWGDRVGVDVVRHQLGGDAAAVVFDALAAARARGADVVVADTAGRLHTKKNLMEELRKIGRVVERELGRPADETLLVLDATTGQNALIQAQEFAQVVPLSGLVLTKLDGTAKGGVAITVVHETGLPLKLIGTGERLQDLEDFDARRFVEALLGD